LQATPLNVPLFWLGSLLLPVLGWTLFRTARRLTPGESSGRGLGAALLGLGFALVIVATTAVVLYGSARSRQAAETARRAEMAARVEAEHLADIATSKKSISSGSASETNAVASASKRQRFDPQPNMAARTSWTVMAKPSVFNPHGWAILARMSLDGVVPARQPGETNEFCRIRMTKGNDDHITLKIEDVAAGSVMTVTLNRDERAEILVNGQGYRVVYLSAQVALDQPDTTPFAMISVSQVREDDSSGPGEESKARPIPTDAAVALREWGDYVRSKTVRELTDPEVAKVLAARQQRLAELLRGTTAESLWTQLEQAGTAARKAYSVGDDNEYQRWLKVQESLGEQVKALILKQ
jgi:hypothetical protein